MRETRKKRLRLMSIPSQIVIAEEGKWQCSHCSQFFDEQLQICDACKARIKNGG